MDFTSFSSAWRIDANVMTLNYEWTGITGESDPSSLPCAAEGGPRKCWIQRMALASAVGRRYRRISSTTVPSGASNWTCMAMRPSAWVEQLRHGS